MSLTNAAGMLAGFAVDALVGDPRRFHPVAGFGRAATALERRLYRPDRAAGAAFTAVAVGVPVAVAVAASVATHRRPVARAVLVAAGTWAVLGARTLRREAGHMAGALERADLTAARGRLSHLCGRDPSALDEPELARATVESVAENTSDAVVAPLFWGAVAGLPGLVGYRAVNTLDAMVGHRSARYARFGTVAARLDDVLNLVPSRLTAALTVAAAPVIDGERAETLRVWRRDGRDHPSPNAGHCEAAMAGALGVRLGGRNVYFGRSETRPFLGDGPRPAALDIRRAARLSGTVGVAAVALAAGIAAAAGLAGRLGRSAGDGHVRVHVGRSAGGAGRGRAAGTAAIAGLAASRADPAARAGLTARAGLAAHADLAARGGRVAAVGGRIAAVGGRVAGWGGRRGRGVAGGVGA